MKTSNALSHFIEKRASKKLSALSIINILFLSLIHIAIMVVLLAMELPAWIFGILTHVQSVITIGLTALFFPYGYSVSVGLNIMVITAILITVLNGRNEALPGLFASLTNLISITIIHFFCVRFYEKLTEISHMNNKIKSLYQNLAAAEAQYWMQSNRLREYDKVVEENQKKLDFLTYIDVPSGLPNRQKIMNRLHTIISIAEKKALRPAIVLINFDNFKLSIGLLGPESAEATLQSAISRLKELIHPADLLGKLGGDEFALLISRRLEHQEMLDYVESLRVALMSSGWQLATPLSASFGISVYPKDGLTATELLKSADIALSYAKDDGKNTIKFFTATMREEAEKKRFFNQKLAMAAENNELYMLYQPQHDTQTQRIRGVEALVRWKSPDIGLVMPGEFIPAAEKNGLIGTIGEWILRKSCTEFKKITNGLDEPITLAVNISALQVMSPGFVETVKAILKETELPPEQLELEITESVLISSLDYIADILTELKALGIRIALDDFGTGYSSLSCLQTLPIDTLKIDKLFISSLHENNCITGAIIELAHQLGFTVVAEGVEQESQLSTLQKTDCDCVQGYLLSQPLCSKDLRRLLCAI